MDHRDLLYEVLARSRAAIGAPDTPIQMLPQLLGVATRAAAELRRAGPALDKQPWQDDHPNGHPELPPVLPIMPGPAWDPFRGLPEDQADALNQRLLARAWVYHHDRATEIREWITAEEILAVEIELRQARQTTQPLVETADNPQVCYHDAHSAPPAGPGADPGGQGEQGARDAVHDAVDNFEVGPENRDPDGPDFRDQDSRPLKTESLPLLHNRLP